MSDRDPVADPRAGDVWDAPSGLVRLVVTNGRLQGFVHYLYFWAGDRGRRRSCPPRKWAARVSGYTYRGME